MTVWYGVANGADFSIAEKKSARAGIDLATVRDPRAWVEIADPSLIGVFDRNTMRYAWEHGLLDLLIDRDGEPVIAVTRQQMVVWLT